MFQLLEEEKAYQKIAWKSLSCILKYWALLSQVSYDFSIQYVADWVFWDKWKSIEAVLLIDRPVESTFTEFFFESFLSVFWTYCNASSKWPSTQLITTNSGGDAGVKDMLGWVASKDNCEALVIVNVKYIRVLKTSPGDMTVWHGKNTIHVMYCIEGDCKNMFVCWFTSCFA